MKKISKAKIISTYAAALYGAAEEKKAVAKVLEDIRQLVVILREDGSIVKYLANPVWNLDSKREALSEVARKLKLDKETLNCLDIVAANGRFGELLPILEEFQHIWYRKNGYVEASVQSAQALSNAQEKSLTANLEKMLSKKVVVNYQIVGRRAGDIEKVWANPELANNELGWKAEVGIEDTLLSAWNWQLKLRERGIQ